MSGCNCWSWFKLFEKRMIEDVLLDRNDWCDAAFECDSAVLGRIALLSLPYISDTSKYTAVMFSPTTFIRVFLHCHAERETSSDNNLFDPSISLGICWYQLSDWQGNRPPQHEAEGRAVIWRTECFNCLFRENVSNCSWIANACNRSVGGNACNCWLRDSCLMARQDSSLDVRVLIFLPFSWQIKLELPYSRLQYSILEILSRLVQALSHTVCRTSQPPPVQVRRTMIPNRIIKHTLITRWLPTSKHHSGGSHGTENPTLSMFEVSMSKPMFQSSQWHKNVLIWVRYCNCWVAMMLDTTQGGSRSDRNPTGLVWESAC